MKNFLLTSLALTVVFAGCTDLASSDIKTAGIRATLSITNTGSNGVTARAQFNVDTNATDFVELSTGDTVVAKANGQTVTLSESKLLGAVAYTGNLTASDAATQYTISLNRSTDTSAPGSTCTMPAALSITTPAASASFSRNNDDISVTYSGSGQSDPLSWSVTGDCVTPVSSQTLPSDTGSFTIPKGTIKQLSNSTNAVTNCQITLTVNRTRNGTLDPSYNGGLIQAIQSRSVTLNSAP
jgi:hypothetical protein